MGKEEKPDFNRTVFRALLSMPNSGPDPKRAAIELSDPMLEHSWVLEPLLDIVYTGDTSLIDEMRRTRLVLDLADKWEFGQARALIHGAVSTRVLTEAGGWSIKANLSLCIRLKDPKLVAACIRAHRNETWSTSRSKKPEPNLAPPFSNDSLRRSYDGCAPGLKKIRSLQSTQVLDLGTWAYMNFLQIPPTIVWAMLRATHLGTTKMATIDHEKVLPEIEKLLTLACE